MMIILTNPLDATVIVHLIATTAMFGIVLFVHAVQYPMLGKVPAVGREEFEREYAGRAGIVIMPLMLIEAGSAAAILFADPSDTVARAGVAVLAAIWLVTFAVSVPCHSRLSREWRDRTHVVLLWSNLVRCLGWGARVVIAVRMLTLLAKGV